MSTLFSAINDEFRERMETVINFVALFDVGSIAGPSETTTRILKAEERIALINGLLLVTSSSFEVFTRELSATLIDEITKTSPSFTLLPHNLQKSQVIASLDELKRHSDVNKRDLASAAAIVESLSKAFKDEPGYRMLSASISRNRKNLWPGEIDSIFGKSGLRSMWGESCSTQTLKDYFGVDESAEVDRKAKATIVAFLNARNDASHSVDFSSSVSVGLLVSQCNFLKALAQAMTETVETYLKSLSSA